MRPLEELQRQVAPLRVESDFEPSGDQPTAIADLERRINAGEQDVVPVLLLGAAARSSFVTTSATSKVSVSDDAIRSLSSDT